MQSHFFEFMTKKQKIDGIEVLCLLGVDDRNSRQLFEKAKAGKLVGHDITQALESIHTYGTTEEKYIRAYDAFLKETITPPDNVSDVDWISIRHNHLQTLAQSAYASGSKWIWIYCFSGVQPQNTTKYIWHISMRYFRLVSGAQQQPKYCCFVNRNSGNVPLRHWFRMKTRNASALF